MTFAPQHAAVAGWYNERSVAWVLWELARSEGFAPVHKAMAALRDGRAFSSLHAFANAMRRTAPLTADALDTLLVSQSTIASASASSDEYGSGESNLRQPFPGLMSSIYTAVALAQPAMVCALGGPLGIPNKLHNHRFMRFDVPAGGSYRLRVSALPLANTGRDPDLSGLVDRQRRVLDDDVGPVDVLVTLPAGPFVFVVSDYDVLSGRAAAACMSVAIDAQR